MSLELGPKARRQKECDAREVDCLRAKWAPGRLTSGLRVKSSDCLQFFLCHGISDMSVIVPRRLHRSVCEKVGPLNKKDRTSLWPRVRNPSICITVW